jgi:hypothetical protein
MAASCSILSAAIILLIRFGQFFASFHGCVSAERHRPNQAILFCSYGLKRAIKAKV